MVPKTVASLPSKQNFVSFTGAVEGAAPPSIPANYQDQNIMSNVISIKTGRSPGTTAYLAFHLAMIGATFAGAENGPRSALGMVAMLLSESDSDEAFELACDAIERYDADRPRTPEVFVLAGVVALLTSDRE